MGILGVSSRQRKVARHGGGSPERLWTPAEVAISLTCSLQTFSGCVGEKPRLCLWESAMLHFGGLGPGIRQSYFSKNHGFQV